MTLITCHVSISLDGFVAGPDQSAENPIGVGGLRLHHWHFDTDGPVHELDAPFRDDLLKQRGAYVMGRNMYGPIRGEWTGDWRGWWGPEPPYHAPVFVLTHHPHDPIEMEGGTTFHFVTDGFQSALDQALVVAGDLDIGIAGGASTVRQALAAGALNQITLDVIPVLLGNGERLFDGVADPGLSVIDAVASPHATHLTYRVGS